jgi:hypothetical protein
MSVDLQSLNSKNAAGLLTAAWSYFGHGKATSVQITSLNEEQMGLKIFLKRKETKDVVYTFSAEDKKACPDLSERVGYFAKQHMYPALPPLTMVSVIAWIVPLIILFPQIYTVTIFGKVRDLLMKVISEKIAWYMFYFVVGSHTCESLYVLTLIPPVVQSFPITITWFALTFCLGFPTTGQVLQLSALHKKAKCQ